MRKYIFSTMALLVVAAIAWSEVKVAYMKMTPWPAYTVGGLFSQPEELVWDISGWLSWEDYHGCVLVDLDAAE
jgi:hypothetical protein